VCGTPVKEDEAELEIEWNDGASTSNHHLHARCFAALEFEISEGETQRSMAASGQSDQAPAVSVDKPQPAA